MTGIAAGLSPDRPMARAAPTASLDSDGSIDERTDGAPTMNLYTADLMARELADDRRRDFEANQLAALTRTPRVRPTSWRERGGRVACWFRGMRHGAAT